MVLTVQKFSEQWSALEKMLEIPYGSPKSYYAMMFVHTMQDENSYVQQEAYWQMGSLAMYLNQL